VPASGRGAQWGMSVLRRPWTNANATRVVVVASDERFRTTTRDLLDGLPGALFAGEAVDGPSAAVVCVLGSPDVVVMDARLTWIEASDIVRRIRGARPAMRILAGTASPSTGLAAAALTFGLAVADAPAQDLAGAIRRYGDGPGGQPPAA
jgi:chemotaxis response regulator CheB